MKRWLIGILAIGLGFASASLTPYTAPNGDLNNDAAADAQDLQCQMLLYERLAVPTHCVAQEDCPAATTCRPGFDAEVVCLPECVAPDVTLGATGQCTDPGADDDFCLGTVEKLNADLNCDGAITNVDINFLVSVIMDKSGGPGTADYDDDGQLNFCDPDSDGDGESPPKDCDDLDPTSYSAAPETCDGADNDCNGLIDGDDGDLVLQACEKQIGVCSGALKSASHCVDGSWNPCIKQDYIKNNGAYRVVELCCDGLDNDCDGLIDMDDADIPCGNGVCDASFGETCATCHADCGDCEGSCCLPHEGAGCKDLTVQDCVCDLDPFCCYAEWDFVCAAEADGCGVCFGNCCSVHETPGCDTEAIEECVCAAAPECCNDAWSAPCVQAVTMLGCGECAPLPSCGDAACNGDETCNTCPQDCGGCCGNGACDTLYGESCVNCPSDCGPCSGSCCTAKESTGCADQSVMDCVCAIDASCCAGPWDSGCATEADNCGSCGGNCCDANLTPGCADETIEACVCAHDPYCCDSYWDGICVDEAQTLGCVDCVEGIWCGDGECNGDESLTACPEDCAQFCGNGVCNPEYGENCLLCSDDCGVCPASCCSIHEGPGCDVQETEDCVCAKMPECCQEGWTFDCVLAVNLLGCDECAALPTCGDGVCVPQADESCVSCIEDCGTCPESCCLEHESYGCLDAAVQSCVCADLPYCCTDAWDLGCATAADNCGSCDGACCAANSSAGCEDESTEACVCAQYPECCQQPWDDDCAQQVALLGCDDCEGLITCDDGVCQPQLGENCYTCSSDCGSCAGSCCTAHENFGCQDEIVQNCVCDTLPDCCSDTWDEGCAALADSCGSCTGDCCAENGTPGCADQVIESCVCAADPFCCLWTWDEICVDEVGGKQCGSCP